MMYDKGDMGTRASEKTLMKTSAGKAPGSALEAHMGRAVKHLSSQVRDDMPVERAEKMQSMRDTKKGTMEE